MNKTDAEILKALECCGNIVDSTCKECAYHKTYNASCVVSLMRDALDLINRNKEMINGLIAGQETLQKGMAEKNKEITRLQGIILAFMDEVAKLEDKGIDVSRFPLIPICDEGRNAIDKFSALARKEFAERLKEKSEYYSDLPFKTVHVEDIDNLVKEMTENEGKE